MLLSFSVENFKCFADEMHLSLTSSRLRTNVPRPGETWQQKTERVAAIFGANASGKTTVLNALWALGVALRSPGSRILRQPYAGNDDNVPTRFSIDFIANDVRYSYSLSAASWGIESEELYSYPKGTRRTLFVRSQQNPNKKMHFTKGGSLTGPTAEVRRITRTTALLLATAHRYEHEVLTPIANALVADIGISFVSFHNKQDHSVLQRVISEMIDSQGDETDLVGALLAAADLGISGLQIKREELPAEVVNRIRAMLEAARTGDEPIDEVLVPKLMEAVEFEHSGPHGQTFMLRLQDESSGTITWLTMAWHVVVALRNGSILLVDELDASLHPELARHLVKWFLNPELNTLGSQLIFTTHDTSLLSNSPTRILEANNVWFVEKDRAGRSELFSLADFTNHPANNRERQYLAGKFGATPEVDDALLLRFINHEHNVSERTQIRD